MFRRYTVVYENGLTSSFTTTFYGGGKHPDWFSVTQTDVTNFTINIPFFLQAMAHEFSVRFSPSFKSVWSIWKKKKEEEEEAQIEVRLENRYMYQEFIFI